ncbi:GNAT family N-acetyltransferase [Amycolatopsis alkalitolerans]|uniref:GNAT family N-acetyltransferase n=1 Tax=Amycolatopsis alkalitolerans TaxID=2547244 RepID=A0A5C4LS62_9PSEU|nr:GNAT family N-acetyltransferase [Amycolatopsis alkalitolerans]TNC19221.1 GNAT family N-acetyltransferase [Amycolatopsis alkalitolerans]
MTVEFADIRTERLLLRRLAEADRETVVRIQTDPRTNAHNPDPPDAEHTNRKFDLWLRDWRIDGFCYLPVVELASRQVIGIGGLQLRRFGGEDVLNLYYRFLPEAWGKGYATEMSLAMIDWADRVLPRYPVQISVSVGNQPSLNVAKRLGFRTHLETIHDGALTRHFRRD